MNSRVHSECSDRAPTLHPSQLAWIGFASWCQTGGFCSNHCRLFWLFGSGKYHLSYPGVIVPSMFASSNYAVAIQIPIAV